MALLRRRDTGVGDYLDISMHNVTVGGMLNVLGPAMAENRATYPTPGIFPVRRQRPAGSSEVREQGDESIAGRNIQSGRQE